MHGHALRVTQSSSSSSSSSYQVGIPGIPLLVYDIICIRIPGIPLASGGIPLASGGIPAGLLVYHSRGIQYLLLVLYQAEVGIPDTSMMMIAFYTYLENCAVKIKRRRGFYFLH